MDAHAKEAALAIIERMKAEALRDCSVPNADWHYIDKLQKIHRKVEEYQLGEDFFTSILKEVHKELMANQHFQNAENVSKHFARKGEFSLGDDSEIAKAERGEFRFSIFVTAVFGIIFFIVMAVGNYLPIIATFILTLVYLYLHPYIGKIWYLVTLLPCRQIDKIFELRDDKSWANNLTSGALIFAALWPIAGPIVLTISLVGAIIATAFKSVFFSNQKK